MASSRMSRAKRSDVDMTQGSIMGHIIRFALPLMLGNLFQQLYNTVDTWVVGNYVSNEAFSAVGTVGPIINMLIGFFTGLATGSGVVISQYYGAKRYDKVRSTVHTAILMTLVLGVLFTAIGILMTPAMLRLMKTPETVFPESSAYLTIYFAGILGLMVYNMGAGILRAVGDSKRPFYFLIVSALLNTVLDLLFVLVFHMGVKGVALATVVAQAISAALVLYVLARTDSCIKLSPQYLKPDFAILGKIIKVGFPAALQMAVTAFSNIFVQSYINHFGADCMAGWTAYAKIDQFILLPAQSIALASTTFVGQNLGINDIARAKKGVGTAVRIGVVTTLLLMLPVIAFAPGLVAFFNSKPEVIEYGSMFLRRISPFYVLVCFNHIYAGALRGAGNSKVPTI
ncbi:MAG: MATE family efflux transporter, partial [Clostridiales bacterium]|nr:MATE family efflux transporter [Clostridiales bacterium]